MTSAAWPSYHRSEWLDPAFAASALGHLALIGALIWGVRISNQTPAALEAELWITPAPAPTEVTVRTPVPVVTPDLSAMVAPDIVLEKTAPPKTPPAPAPRASSPSTPTPRVQPPIRPPAAHTANAPLPGVDGLLALAGSGAGSAPAQNKAGGGGNSQGWLARTASRIRGHTIFNAEGVSGNPTVEFEVELDPAGDVLKTRKKRSSGLPGFDEAVERAVFKSAPFPPDASGRVPRSFTLVHRLRDE